MLCHFKADRVKNKHYGLTVAEGPKPPAPDSEDDSQDVTMFNAPFCHLLSGFLGFHDDFGTAPNFNFKDLMVEGCWFADVADILFPKIPACKECNNEVPATKFINGQFTGFFDQMVFASTLKIVLESGQEGTVAQAFADRQAGAMEALLRAETDAPRRAMVAWQEKYLPGPDPAEVVAAAVPNLKRISVGDD